jgi:hypothetical protein
VKSPGERFLPILVILLRQAQPKTIHRLALKPLARNGRQFSESITELPGGIPEFGGETSVEVGKIRSQNPRMVTQQQTIFHFQAL